MNIKALTVKGYKVGRMKRAVTYLTDMPAFTCNSHTFLPRVPYEALFCHKV